MKLTSKTHGIVDYLMVIFLWTAPSLFNLPDISSTITYGLGIIHLALTAFTNYEYGLIRFIPLKIHSVIELVFSFALTGLAFYLHHMEGEISRNFFLGIALVLFIVWLFTDYTNKLKGTQEIPYIESNTDGGML